MSGLDRLLFLFINFPAPRPGAGKFRNVHQSVPVYRFTSRARRGQIAAEYPCHSNRRAIFGLPNFQLDRDNSLSHLLAYERYIQSRIPHYPCLKREPKEQ